MTSASRALREINAILWRDWDPIGCGVPEDEYESYAPGVLQLLLDGADAATLAEHLKRVAQDCMGCVTTDARAMSVAAKLMAVAVR